MTKHRCKEPSESTMTSSDVGFGPFITDQVPPLHIAGSIRFPNLRIKLLYIHQGDSYVMYRQQPSLPDTGSVIHVRYFL